MTTKISVYYHFNTAKLGILDLYERGSSLLYCNFVLEEDMNKI